MDHVTIRNTVGAGFIGAIVTSILYGLTTLQTYLFYTYYPEDSWDIKFLVSIIWLLDTTHVVLMCHAVYYYLVSNFGNLSALSSGIWSLYASISLNLAIAIIVQTFFCIRIYHICRPALRWWLASILFVAVLAHLGFGVESITLLFIKKEFSKVSAIKDIAMTPFAVSVVLSDVLIAGSLCVILYGRRTSYTSTNSVINTLIVYAVNRCLLTSFVAIAEVIVFALLPNNMLYLAIDFVIGKLYANSLLAHLNSRHSLRFLDDEEPKKPSKRGSRRATFRFSKLHFVDVEIPDAELRSIDSRIYASEIGTDTTRVSTRKEIQSSTSFRLSKLSVGTNAAPTRI